MAEILLSVDQVAERLGLHVKTVRGYIRDGRLRATRIGKQYRITRADLEVLTGRPATESEADTVRRQRHVSVSSIVEVDAISPGGVEPDHESSARRGQGSPRRRSRAADRNDLRRERARLKLVVIGGLRENADLFALLRMLLEG